MGYGLIKTSGKTPELMVMGVLNLSKYPDHMVKLRHIFTRVTELINQYHPDEMAVEAPFFGKNVQSMLKLGRAQGAAIAAALQKDMPVVEYAPRKIKQSITGNGNAAKEQVAAMLQQIFKIPDDHIPKELDATDGLAVALCHFYQSGTLSSGSSFTGWKAFVNQNKDRLR